METRQKELEKVKKIMKKYIKNAKCGFFDTRNIAGDEMVTIFEGENFTLDWCPFWEYYELFGTTNDEFTMLKKYYRELCDR